MGTTETELTTRIVKSNSGDHEFIFCNQCDHWDRKWKMFAKLEKCECCVSKFTTAEIAADQSVRKPTKRSAARDEKTPSEQAQYMREYRERKRNGEVMDRKGKPSNNKSGNNQHSKSATEGGDAA